MKKAILFLFLAALVVAALGLGLPTRPPAQATGSVVYLGQGGSHELPEGQGVFVVKRGSAFFTDPGPVYHAQDRDRVWASQMGGPEAVTKATLDLGQVPAGCLVAYTAIDDDPDDRQNTFMIDGQPAHTMGQGMVTSGEFTSPPGHLTLQARDSIGLWVTTCPIIDDTPGPPDPTATTEATRPPATATPEATATAGRPPVEKPTQTPMAGKATHTPEATRPPATAQPTATIEATRPPRLPACTRINWEISGHYTRPGTYVVSEVWGRVLTTWQTDRHDLQDSGAWLGFDITFPAVWVTVTYHPGDGRPPVEMAILNHAPEHPWGWLARGQCHAIEVGWPVQ